MGRRRREGIGFVGVLVRLVVMLAVLAGIGIVAYAFVGDLSPEQVRIERAVDLDGR